MIRFTLKCPEDHRFDSWFSSSEAFDKLCASGLIVCTACGSTQITKAIMAPQVSPSRNTTAARMPATDAHPLTAPSDAREVEQQRLLAKLREKVESSSDYVGMEFAREARAIHAGEAPERPIYGEARIDEARSLLEDGVPVAPLPFMPKRKTN